MRKIALSHCFQALARHLPANCRIVRTNLVRGM
jgi:hypothetical protein